MSSKINFLLIIKDHFKTLSDVSGKGSLTDFATFLAFPLAVALVFAIKGDGLKSDVVSMLVNFGSIFTALLLSVLMLVYEQRNKLEERRTAKLDQAGVAFYCEKKKLLEQLYSNISYAVVASMLLVLFSFAYVLVDKVRIKIFEVVDLNDGNWFAVYLLTPVLLFLTVNLILTIFMVVKRTYSLLMMKM